MKTSLPILFLTALATAAVVRAQDPNTNTGTMSSSASSIPATSDPRSDYSITSDFTYTSKYVFRGVQQARESFQPSVEFASGGFNAGVWTNQPITRHENDEVDFYTGYDYNLNSALKLEGVATYYYYPEAKRSLGQTRHSYEGGVGATYTVDGFSPNLYYYHDFRLNSDTVQAAVGYSLPLGSNGFSVDTSLFAAAVNQRSVAPDATAVPGVHDSYNYWGADVTFPYKMSRNATLTVGAHYANTDNLSPANGGLGNQNFWYTAGVSIGF
jgi:uncharacterized protein (TIGR02001 family)